MDNINLIYDYLDGNIESSLEEKFFLLLSSNEEMRLEFRQQLAIKEAVRSDSKAFTPKVESTAAIFSSLGFNAPSNKIPNDLIATKTSFQQRYSQGLIGGILASVLTLVIVLLFFRNSANDTNNDPYTSEVQKQSYPININDSNSNFAYSDKNNPINKTTSDNKTVYKYIKNPTNTALTSNSISKNKDLVSDVNKNEQIHQTKHNTLQKSNEINTIESSNKIYFSDIYSNRINNSNFTLSTFKLINSSFLPQLTIDKQRLFSLEIKGIQSWYIVDASINPNEYASFNNSSLGLFYALNENLSTGLELRQENFYQKYYVTDSIGNLYLYEQQPNITSFNLGFRYRFSNIDVFYPIIQSSLGLTNTGIIGRLSAGIEYQPFSTMSIIFGLEFSDLFYHHNNTIYGSSKFGIFYGASIKF